MDQKNSAIFQVTIKKKTRKEKKNKDDHSYEPWKLPNYTPELCTFLIHFKVSIKIL